MKRSHLEPLPKSGVLGVLHYVQRALVLPGMQEVSITPQGISVTREMAEDDEVVPGVTNDVDVDFLLSHVELLTHPFSPEEHGTAALFAAGQALGKIGCEARWLIAPSWPLVAAWLGVELEVPPKLVYGFSLKLAPSGSTNGRVVLLGSPPRRMFLSDATFGVAIDLGV